MPNRRKKRYGEDRVPTYVRRHARHLAAVVLGIVVWFLLPADDKVLRFLIAWNAGIWFFILLVLKMMSSSDIAEIRRRAGVEDEGRSAVLIVTIAAAIASIIALIAQMSAAQELKGAERIVSTAIALSTIFGSWLLVHFDFALFYAHEFYVPSRSEAEAMKGLKFSGGEPPDYWDFLYFSIVMGSTFQTSDTEVVSRRMRRIATVHGLLSFLFNTAVIALTVNIAAQLF